MNAATLNDQSSAARLERASAKLAEARTELELVASGGTAENHLTSLPSHLRSLRGIEDYCFNLRALFPDPATVAPGVPK